MDWFLYDRDLRHEKVKAVFISDCADIESEITKWKSRDVVLVSFFKKCQLQILIFAWLAYWVSEYLSALRHFK